MVVLPDPVCPTTPVNELLILKLRLLKSFLSFSYWNFILENKISLSYSLILMEFLLSLIA